MIKTSKFLLVIIILSSAIASCKKEKQQEFFAECPARPSFNISYFTHDRFQYKAPYYNPNNSVRLNYEKDNNHINNTHWTIKNGIFPICPNSERNDFGH